MKKLQVMLLVVLISVFTVSAASAFSWGYGEATSRVMSLWDTVFPQCPLDPEELGAGEYRLHMNIGKFTGIHEERWGPETEQSWETEFNAKNFFFGLDLALNEAWYLSVGYNVVPEFTCEEYTYEDYDWQRTARADLLNVRLTHLLNEDTRLFGGFARSSEQYYRRESDEEYDDSDSDIINYLYLGAEYYGTLFK